MRLNEGDTISLGFKSHNTLTPFSTPIEKNSDVLLLSKDESDEDDIIIQCDNDNEDKSSNDELDKDDIIMQCDNHNGDNVSISHQQKITIDDIIINDESCTVKDVSNTTSNECSDLQNCPLLPIKNNGKLSSSMVDDQSNNDICTEESESIICFDYLNMNTNPSLHQQSKKTFNSLEVTTKFTTFQSNTHSRKLHLLTQEECEFLNLEYPNGKFIYYNSNLPIELQNLLSLDSKDLFIKKY